ncbi:MAG: transglutaminase domain-containing protein [Haloarculaceae archaeon]
MSDADAERTSDRRAGREYGRAAFAVVCVCAVVLAAALAPALAAGSGAPASSLVPLPPGASDDAGPQSGSETGAGGDSGSAFGALNAGDSQEVGGLGENAFRSQSTETHFTVRSERRSYWRTGAYDTYTGSGWRRSAPSDATAPTGGESLRYRVDLARAASSPPTVWRPERLAGPDGLGLTDGRRATSDGVLPEGTTYRGTSSAPPSAPRVLAASGRDYPDAIEERYTALPAETESALGPFTDGVVENASGPYETAVAVERWLERTKSYSLNVSKPEGDVARRFVLGMDEGYCEYFATAMVAMLRSQDVPARYVVGYSTGEQVDSDTYRVRGLNAHAWVEVYFADVGWVRFDPTPGGPRVARERRTLQERGVTDEYSPDASGSPGERTDGTGTATPTPAGSDVTPTPAPTPDGTGEYRLSLNRSAVPGAAVTVTVEAGGRPVSDAAVRFDGWLVDMTDSDGTVVTRLPYEQSVTVTARGGETAGGDSDSLPAGVGTNASRDYDLPTNATLSVSGDQRVGATVTVVATVEGVPVRNATVLLDGGRVERTDDRGRAGVGLPQTPGNVTLGVERGAVTGSATVAVDRVAVAVDPALGLPVAWTPVEVTALVNGDPEPGATVTVGGTAAGETGIGGTTTAWLPARSAVPVTVAARGQTARTTVANPLVNLAGLVALAVGALLAGGFALVRSSGGPRDLRRVVRRGGRALVAGVVALAIVGERALAAGGRRARTALAHLRGLARGERSVEELAAALGAWLGALPARVTAATPTRSGGRRDRGRPAGAGAEGAERPVRDGWARFLEHVSVDRPDVYTPGQLAAHAIAVDGLPRDAVTTLRDEFRAVEYGPRSPDVAAPGVTAAVDAIEAAAGDDTDERASGARDDDDATGGER